MAQAIKIKRGDKYGRLTLTGLYKSIKSGERKKAVRYVECECRCGTKKRVRFAGIRTGAIQSCGCQKQESALKTSNKHKTHGQSRTRLYIIYTSIKCRCNNEKNGSYQNYGGRGIKCQRNTYDEFKKDMEKSYLEHVRIHGEKETKIERIDNDGNYCKENCRRATTEEQANNKRTNHKIEYNGKEYTIANICKEFNIPYLRTLRRINKGWNIEHAIKIPSIPKEIQGLANYDKIIEHYKQKGFIS